MTIQDVKQIKLADYLQSLGYTPVKQQGIIQTKILSQLDFLLY